MEYTVATTDMANEIYNIFQTTIKEIYPKYYPLEVVDFFCNHHSLEHTISGISTGNMRVLTEGDTIVGIGCFNSNHITGVYVLPRYQRNGYGSIIMNNLENEISKNHSSSVLEASLPAVFMYEKWGYKTVGHGVYQLKNDVKLVYEIMEKNL